MLKVREVFQYIRHRTVAAKTTKKFLAAEGEKKEPSKNFLPPEKKEKKTVAQLKHYAK